MEKSYKNKLTIILLLASFCIGIFLVIFFFTSALRASPDSHFKGNATKAEIAKFNEYYEDFVRVSSFVLEKYAELPAFDESDGGSTFRVNVEDGKIMHFLAENDAKGYFYDVPFDCDAATSDSIESIGRYFGSGLLLVNVVGGKTLYIHDGERTIYSPDNSIPKYTYHPREMTDDYLVYKLRDNWFTAK